MKGGVVRENEPYGDADLEHEFGRTHVLTLCGTEYSASPVRHPDWEPVRAGSALELAMKLRAQGQHS